MKHVVLTLGGAGAALCTLSCGDRVTVQHLPAAPAQIVNTNGAGDCLVAGCLACLLQGSSAVLSLAFGMVSCSSLNSTYCLLLECQGKANHALGNYARGMVEGKALSCHPNAPCFVKLVRYKDWEDSRKGVVVCLVRWVHAARVSAGVTFSARLAKDPQQLCCVICKVLLSLLVSWAGCSDVRLFRFVTWCAKKHLNAYQAFATAPLRVYSLSLL